MDIDLKRFCYTHKQSPVLVTDEFKVLAIFFRVVNGNGCRCQIRLKLYFELI